MYCINKIIITHTFTYLRIFFKHKVYFGFKNLGKLTITTLVYIIIRYRLRTHITYVRYISR